MSAVQRLHDADHRALRNATPRREFAQFTCSVTIVALPATFSVVAWGLEQTKYFTQGYDNLVVVTDHKPLTKTFGDQTLDEISNTRLFQLKQRTLMWCFDIAHLPGSTNTAADATSRYPATSEFFATISGAKRDSIDSLKKAFLASVRQNTRDELTLNWDEIARHTASDAALNNLLSVIQSNFDVNFPPKGGIR